ncbi:MAG: hypothetical protein KatS3mg111_2728 [Pirellulaceae bacterium]|nr:MAG: hypothetical protein KatS3mg111_2728 [Pirellulaceae bacterium]
MCSRVPLSPCTVRILLREILSLNRDRWSSAGLPVPSRAMACEQSATPLEAPLRARLLENLARRFRGVTEGTDNCPTETEPALAPALRHFDVLDRQSQRLACCFVLHRWRSQLQCTDTLLLECLVQAVDQQLHSISLDVDQHDRQAESLAYDLAYGLGHELNNPLASIATRAGALAARVHHPEVASTCHAIVEHAMRGKEMIADLMAVTKPPPLRWENVALKPLLETIACRAKRWIDTSQGSISVAITAADDVTFSADPTALCEAIWALVRNAVEAVDPRQGQVELTGTPVTDGVRIDVADNGPGIAPALLQRVWNPYFCGREAGRNLGLGLYKVRRIALLHGGQADIENLQPTGCRASILLPTLTI